MSDTMRTGKCDSCFLITKIIASSLGILFGISAFIVYMFVFENYNAAVWAFVSGIFALSFLHLNVLYMKNKIDEWYDPSALENLKLLGLLVVCSSTVSFGIYLSLAITRHQDLVLMDDFLYSYYPAAIFSALSFNWGLALYLNSAKYKKYVQMFNPEFVYNVNY